MSVVLQSTLERDIGSETSTDNLPHAITDSRRLNRTAALMEGKFPLSLLVGVQEVVVVEDPPTYGFGAIF